MGLQQEGVIKGHCFLKPFAAQGVSLWRVKSSGVRRSKIYKSLLGSKGLSSPMTRKSCAVGLRNAVLRNHFNRLLTLLYSVVKSLRDASFSLLFYWGVAERVPSVISDPDRSRFAHANSAFKIPTSLHVEIYLPRYREVWCGISVYCSSSYCFSTFGKWNFFHFPFK